MMLDRGEQLDWFSSTEILVEAVLARSPSTCSWCRPSRPKQPFIDPHIFKDRNFTIGLCFIFVVGIILLASLALITPYLQNLMGYPVLTAGLVLAPRGMGTMVAMMIVGRIINRVDARVCWRRPAADGRGAVGDDPSRPTSRNGPSCAPACCRAWGWASCSCRCRPSPSPPWPERCAPRAPRSTA
jgi:Arabinose efflux permease